MTMIRALAHHLFESIGIVQPRIEVMIRDSSEIGTDGKPSRLQWVRGSDSDGRSFVRIQWVEEESRELPASRAHN